jgi:hypothetical protein
MTEEEKIFRAFYQIPLDIEGSNIDRVGWIPDIEDCKYMPEGEYERLLKEWTYVNAKVLFDNVFNEWDSCDCGDGYGCSHGSWVCEIRIRSGDKYHHIELEEDRMFIENQGMVYIPIKASIYDFYRACQLVGIQLELSEYAKSLVEGKQPTV